MTTVITWTQLELRGLLEDDESRVHHERAVRHLTLHPFHLSDLNAALREILTSSNNSYDPKIGGIVLSYKNPKLLTRLGTILYDTPFIHIDIEADFYVFKPRVGDTLKGIVNKKSHGHVGIVVHKTFNATITKADDDKNWPGDRIHIGQEVRFTITYLNLKDGLPYISGALDKQDYLRGCQSFDEPVAATTEIDVKPKNLKFLVNHDEEFNVIPKTRVDDEATDIDSDENKNLSRKKLKKLKKEKKDNHDEEFNVIPKIRVDDEATDIDSDENKNLSRKKLKKLKKEKKDNYDEEFNVIPKIRVDDEATDIDSDENKNLSRKKLKKLKKEKKDNHDEEFNVIPKIRVDDEATDIDSDENKNLSRKKLKKLKKEKKDNHDEEFNVIPKIRVDDEATDIDSDENKNLSRKKLKKLKKEKKDNHDEEFNVIPKTRVDDEATDIASDENKNLSRKKSKKLKKEKKDKSNIALM